MTGSEAELRTGVGESDTASWNIRPGILEEFILHVCQFAYECAGIAAALSSMGRH